MLALEDLTLCKDFRRLVPVLRMARLQVVLELLLEDLLWAEVSVRASDALD